MTEPVQVPEFDLEPQLQTLAAVCQTLCARPVSDRSRKKRSRFAAPLGSALPIYLIGTEDHSMRCSAQLPLPVSG